MLRHKVASTGRCPHGSCRLGQALDHGAASEMLTVQYRMHRDIMDWSSKELYGGKLTAHKSVAEHTLGDFPPAGPVLLLFDTAGCGFNESRAKRGANARSTRNEGEAKAALAHAERLIAAGVPPKNIAIITPYSAQVALLRSMRPGHLAESLEVATVDGFQGHEKEAIIFSAVRSTEKGASGGLGFVRDKRRTNVSITRARRHCALVGDSETLRRDLFLARLLDHFKQRRERVSARELVPQ